MAKHKTHKAQHYIPKSYLAAWCDPATPVAREPYVWTFPPEGGPGRPKSPANLFTETDMYTIRMPDGTRDLRIEHGLGLLEKGLKNLIADFVERRRPIPEPRFVKLIAFIAAMHGRTPRFRDHQRSQWGRVLDLAEEMDRGMSAKTPEERKRTAQKSLPRSGPTMGLDDLREVVETPIQFILPAVLQSEVPILSQMVTTIYCTDRPAFITSDNPVVWFDPKSGSRPPMYQGPALMYETVEITMPLSPRHMIAIHHDQPMSGDIKPVRYIQAWDATVAALNRRTAIYADKAIVAWRDGFDPNWHIPRGAE